MATAKVCYIIGALGFSVGAAANWHQRQFGWMAVGIIGVILDAVLLAVTS